MRGCLDIMSRVTSRVPEIKREIKDGHIESRSQQTGQRKSSTSQIKNQRDGAKTEGVSGLSQHPQVKGHHPRCGKNLKNPHRAKDGSRVKSGTKRSSVRFGQTTKDQAAKTPKSSPTSLSEETTQVETNSSLIQHLLDGSRRALGSAADFHKIQQHRWSAAHLGRSIVSLTFNLRGYPV